MKLTSVSIRRFRSVRDLAVRLTDHAVLVGPNNCGKSNVLRAIEFGVTGGKSLAEDHWALDTGVPIEIELTFNGLDAQEAKTFEKYVGADGTLSVRKESTPAYVRFHGKLRQPSDSTLRDEHVTGLPLDALKAHPCWAHLPPEAKKPTKDQKMAALRAYLESSHALIEWTDDWEAGPLLGTTNVAAAALPEVLFVPGMLDTTEELKSKATSLFGKIVKRVFDSAETGDGDAALAALQKTLQKLSESVNGSDDERPTQIQELERHLSFALAEWRASVRLQVHIPDLSDLLSAGLAVRLTEGSHELAPARKGHGLQRALLFALIRVLGNLHVDRASTLSETVPRKGATSSIILVEEPELYLHPHAQRRMSRELRALATRPGCQVVLASHSTHFVDLMHHRELALVGKGQDDGTNVRQCIDDIVRFDGVAAGDPKERKVSFNLAQWVNPDRAEMFFCRKVIFVEGATEKALLPYLGERLGFDLSDVSWVECGAKHNLLTYVALAKAFQVPFAVIHDEDPLPDPQSENPDKTKTERETFALNAKLAAVVEGSSGEIWMFSPDLEGALGIPKRSAERVGKPLAALEHFESLEELTEYGHVEQLLGRIAGLEAPDGQRRVVTRETLARGECDAPVA